MGRVCGAWGRKFGFSSWENFCGQCQKLFKEELARLEKEILMKKDLSSEPAGIIKKGNKKLRIKLYDKVFPQFETRSELSGQR